METSIEDDVARGLAQRISDPYLAHDAALVAMASTFEGSDPLQLMERLDHAARPMFGIAASDLHAQAGVLAEALFGELGLRVDSDDYRSLLLGHALCTGAAQPLLLAVLGHELARRAGLRSLVASSRGEYWTILMRDACFIPISYMSPPEGNAVAEMQACCAHATSCAMLETINRTAPAEPSRLALRVRGLLPLRPHAEWDEEPGA